MKSRPCWYLDLGLMDFTQAHALQLKILETRTAKRMDQDAMLFLEHPAVFTLGRRGGYDNLRVSPAFLADAGITLHHIERGGDITFHGPGQLVLYPIVHLQRAGLGVHDFVERLEESMIRTAAVWNISAARDPRNRGVWVGNRKLGSIGIAVRRGITFHGLALNVDLSLEPFSWIHPCGLQNIEMTTMNQETDMPAGINAVKTVLRKNLEDVFSLSFQDISILFLKKQINQNHKMIKAI